MTIEKFPVPTIRGPQASVECARSGCPHRAKQPDGYYRCRALRTMRWPCFVFRLARLHFEEGLAK